MRGDIAPGFFPEIDHVGFKRGEKLAEFWVIVEKILGGTDPGDSGPYPADAAGKRGVEGWFRIAPLAVVHPAGGREQVKFDIGECGEGMGLGLALAA